ncbi:MAG TPA: hypothetical protein DEF47_00770 [Herpetosiphon sp.]|uniref:Uncharacterized protein n=1 Tax=Herpetosiphon aurantiacus (strain ATCC 23779 / DSM 785 / 114-95) TaxID=316274 RepID=A9B228_HERA2|nr:hypothetical protein [Herpetosiphon sp.]ABX07378.1 hypothetical protein Haur_4747 [Herpetosiphon aurantiacus DSM 785]HBW48421.1 hypothetical protein [Herpetosiphon sp.]
MSNSPTLCATCKQKPPLWDMMYCAECYQRQLFRQRLGLWGLWMVISVLEMLLNIGVGVVAVSSELAQESSLISLIFSGVMVINSILALCVGVAQTALMKKKIKRWLLWGIAGGLEVLFFWILSMLAYQQFGQVAHLLIFTMACSGICLAIIQSSLMIGQVAQPWRWILVSIGSWSVASLAALLLENQFGDPLLQTIWGHALGRFVYGVFSGLGFAWLLTDRRMYQPKQQL